MSLATYFPKQITYLKLAIVKIYNYRSILWSAASSSPFFSKKLRFLHHWKLYMFVCKIFLANAVVWQSNRQIIECLMEVSTCTMFYICVLTWYVWQRRASWDGEHAFLYADNKCFSLFRACQVSILLDNMACGISEAPPKGTELKCYSQILRGGSAENFKFWLFCIDLVANW